MPVSDPSKPNAGPKHAPDRPPDSVEPSSAPVGAIGAEDPAPPSVEDLAGAEPGDEVLALAADVRVGRDPTEFAAGNVNRRELDASNKEARRREADEDRELILKAQKGDQAAFRRLVERHQRRAFAIAVGLVRDENDARELVQEAFLRVYRSLNSFQGSSSFFTWLYRIVTNLAIDLMRKPGRREAELTDQHVEDEGADFPLVSRIDGADPIDVIRRREIAARIQTALDALPPYHRGVILMREVEGMSYEEMAQAMGVSKGTIMSRLFHARQKLQKALADCYAEEGRGRATGEAPDAPEHGSEGDS